MRPLPSARSEPLFGWQADEDLTRFAHRLCVAAAWIIGVAIAAWSLWVYLGQQPESLGMDARAYYLAGHQENPYQLAPGDPFAVLYSPVFVQLMHVVAQLPWPVFMLLWLSGNVAAYWWLSSPLSWLWRGPVLMLCVPAVLIGNVYGLLCVSFVFAVLGRPASAAGLSLLALTKITPAAIGGLWFVLRRDWGRLTIAVASTAGLVTASVLLDAQLWLDWFEFLAGHSTGSVLRPVRILIAVGLVVWAFRRRSSLWVLGVAFYLSSPMASLVIQELVPLMTIPRLLAAGKDGAGPLRGQESAPEGSSSAPHA